MKLTDEYRQFLRVSGDNFEYFDSDQPVQVDKYECAVLYVMADWSIESGFAFPKLKKALTEVFGETWPLVVILHADAQATKQFFAGIGEAPRGWGETYFIKGGKIISTFKHYHLNDNWLPILKEHLRPLV